MSDLKISQLDELFNPYSSDVIPIVHQGITKKTPISTIVRHLSVVLEDNGGIYLGSNYKSASGHWEGTYTTVLANSAQWAVDSGDVNVDTAVKSNSANWQSTYNTFKSVSSTFLTSETDSQTLTFNETNKNLSISNGNSISLSALVDGAAVDTAVRALTANYTSAYNTVQSNSATNWNYQGTDLKGLSSGWQSTYNTFRAVSSTFLTSETDSQTLSFNDSNKNLTISNGNTVSLSALVDTTGSDTAVRALTANYNSVYNTVQSNSATTWNYQGTDLKGLSSDWVGGNSAYTNLVSNSAAYLSSVDLSFLSVSANWNSVYSNVNSNSANWNAAFGSAGADAAVRALTANWQSTYNTFASVSSTFLTSETDSQTLTFNEGTKNLSISNGNSISLSALVDGTTVDTAVRDLTANYTSVYNTVQSNSAVNWNYQGTDLKGLSSDWVGGNSAYTTVWSNSANWNAAFGSAGADAAVRALTASWVGGNEAYTNLVTNSAAYLSSVDLSFLSVSANWNSVYNTVQSNSAVNWNYQGTDLKELSGNWQDTYTIMQAKSAAWDLAVTSGYTGTDIKALTGNWESTYTTVNTNSADWNYQGTDIKTLTSEWVGGNEAYTNLVTNSAAYLSSVDLSFLSVSSNWDSVYNNVNSNSANWDAAFGSAGTDLAVRELTANWESTYNTFAVVSSTFLTSETDSQTLSFDEGTKDLSISNGNTISLSALVDGTAVDTELRSLTANYDSAYNTVQSNSATNWNYQGTDLKSLSSDWQNTYTTVQSNSATNWNYQGTDLKALSSGWVGGNEAYTTVQSNSANYILNSGNTKGSDLLIGTNDNFNVALETNNTPRITILNSGNVGIGTSSPTDRLTVNGNVSLSGLNLVYSTETKSAPTINTNVLTLDLASACFFSVSLNAAITTFTLTNMPASPKVYSFTLQFVADGTPRTVTWPTGTRWAGGTNPTLTSTLNKVDTFTFLTHNGGTDWFAYTSNQNQ